jgi:hypothetical protein
MDETTEVWEGEGGAAPPAERQLMGTQNQRAWAEHIRAAVNTEFDRVARALESRAGTQAELRRSDTLAMISILEEKHARRDG